MVQTGTADALGSLMFRKVAAGRRLHRAHDGTPRARRAASSRSCRSRARSRRRASTARRSCSPASTTSHARRHHALRLRHAARARSSMGPYPTVRQLLGLRRRRSRARRSTAYAFLCDQFAALCDAPNDPARCIAALFGYATVSVNMRGTGCSGGAYDYFETLQLLDGYDVIETVAAQSWVRAPQGRHDRPLVPRHHAALRRVDAAAEPGRDHAALGDRQHRDHAGARRHPQRRLRARVGHRGARQAPTPTARAGSRRRSTRATRSAPRTSSCTGRRSTTSRRRADRRTTIPRLHDPLNPTTFVNKIDVPVFLAGAWQDEQTGPFFTTLLDHFTASPAVRFTVYNGVHPDGFAPAGAGRVEDVPRPLRGASACRSTDQLVRDVSPMLFKTDLSSVDAAAARSPGERAAAATRRSPTWKARAAAARALRERRRRHARSRRARRHLRAAASPRGRRPRRRRAALYFHADGSLGAGTRRRTRAPRRRSSSIPPPASAASSRPAANVWDQLPAYDWQPPAAGNAAVVRERAARRRPGDARHRQRRSVDPVAPSTTPISR